MKFDLRSTQARGRPQADQRRLQEHYAEWLRVRPWDWYITATFDCQLSKDQAWRLLRDFIEEVERVRRCALAALIVQEATWSGLGKPSSGFHFHLLLRSPKDVSSNSLMQLWATKHYGGSRCQQKSSRPCECGRCEGDAMRACPYNPAERAALYLFKTIEVNPDGWILHREHLLGIRPLSWHSSTRERKSIRRHKRRMREGERRAQHTKPE